MNKSTMNNPSVNDQDGKKEAIVDQAKQAVTHVASQAKEQVSNQLSTQFEGRKDKAVETMGNVADAIRGTSEKLKGVGPLGDVAGRAADGIESVAEFFEGKQIGDIVSDVNRFARREPALFIGAAFAIGLIGGRFLKSSVRKSSGPQGMYAGEGGQYSGSFGDGGYDDFLADDDLEDDVASQRSYGSQRTGRTTQQFGSQRSSGASGSSLRDGMSGGSYGASQGSYGSSTASSGSTLGGSASGSSYGATQGSASGSNPSTTTPATTTKTASVAPPAASTAASSQPATPATASPAQATTSSTPNGVAKNGIGGGSSGSV